MSNLTIRSITTTEYENGAKQVWDACFPDDGAAFIDYYFAKRTKQEYVLAVFDGGRMVADLHMLPKKLSFGGVEKEVAFIAGVGTHPEYRMRGIAGKLLLAAEPLMLAQGYSAAMLQPFLFEFYRKFGYEPFANCSVCKIEPKVSSAVELSLPTPTAMLAFYREFIKPYLGAFVREVKDFELLLEEARICGDFVLTDGTGYAWGRVDEDSIELYEIAGKAPAALAGAVAARYNKPVGFRLPAYYDGENAPFNMIKVLDEPKFMQGLDLPDGFWRLPEYAEKCFGIERY